MVFMIEAQITYILDCLRTMERRNLRRIEMLPASQETFNEELQQRMQGTVWASGCVSWYLDVGGRNTTLWPGFTFEFWRKTRHFDPQHYNLASSPVPREQAKRPAIGVYTTLRRQRVTGRLDVTAPDVAQWT
jgi:hypothetical protein